MVSASACLLWLLLVVVYDFRQRRVPNWLVLAGAVSALAALAIGSLPFESGWRASLLGAGVGFGVLLLFYVVGLMGAGDVKFAAALGLWVGAAALLPIWIIASLLAGLHGLLWLVLRRWAALPRLVNVLFGQPAVASKVTKTRFIPYAAYLALATVAWMLWSRQG